MATSRLKSPISRFPLNLIEIKHKPSKIKSKSNNINSCKPVLSCIFSNPTSSKKQKADKISLSCLSINEPLCLNSSSVLERVQSLDFEFKSLPEPIDRVRRLLQYANVLPRFDELLKIPENRVKGCTAQVWLDVEMDQTGVMKFRVDSDSEIVKGFCSCLIWVLDGAEAEEILMVKTEDLAEMNVGLPVRGNSRVNSWHSLLNSMQKRTRELVLERDVTREQHLDDFSSLIR